MPAHTHDGLPDGPSSKNHGLSDGQPSKSSLPADTGNNSSNFGSLNVQQTVSRSQHTTPHSRQPNSSKYGSS